MLITGSSFLAPAVMRMIRILMNEDRCMNPVHVKFQKKNTRPYFTKFDKSLQLQSFLEKLCLSLLVFNFLELTISSYYHS